MSRTFESFSRPRHDKVMNILAEATGGKSYKAHKYVIDHADRPTVDYGDSEIIWKRRAETTQQRTYVDLSRHSKKFASRDDQILSYFIDGSRRVFKVDDIAYAQSGGRSVIFPVIAGQIGIGCCHRINKKIVPAKFKREFVLSMPDVADADGKSGFWPATAKKLSECDELKRLGIEFAAILPYKTSKSDDKKFEDRATACVQDRMIECEKKLVAELVREGKLNHNNYLVKDGNQLARVLHEAFYVARTGRPGPVVIDIPKNIQQAKTQPVWPTLEQIKKGLPGYNQPDLKV